MEHAGIDILITNDQRQAVCIENKVYAQDQKQQLRRYHDTLVRQRYGPIFVRYLTLHGSRPNDQSLAGLDLELPEPYFQCISYASQIWQWLQRSEGIAVRDVPLRESISQYTAVIDQLTGNDQEKGYMDAMVETLLIGENMLLARDIRAAYVKGLVELQDRLWTDIERVVTLDHPQMRPSTKMKSLLPSPERKATMENFYRPGAQSNRFYGLYFEVPGWEAVSVGIEMDTSLCSGVFCEKNLHGEEYNRVRQVLADGGVTGAATVYCPYWRPYVPDYNLREPDQAALEMLTDESKRAEFARHCVNDMAQLWQACAAASQR